MRQKSRKPHGFTLVELLVVITIIGMLMALAFPAIGSVLEEAKRAKCQANLRSLGLALKTYAAAQGCLPPGQPSCVDPKDQWRTGGESSGAKCQGPNWALAILGQLDEKALAAGVKKCLSSTNSESFCANTCEDVAVERFGNVGLSTPNVFLCPSADEMIDGLAGGDATWGLQGQTKGNYAANFGKATFEEAIYRPSDPLEIQEQKRLAMGPFSVKTIRRRNARGGSRGTSRKDLMGAWKAGRQMGMPMAAIEGNQQRTILLSEVRGYDSPVDGRGVWTNTSMGASIFTAKTPPNAMGDKENEEWYDHIQICDENIAPDHPSSMHCIRVRNKKNQVWAAARSEHAGVVNVLFCGFNAKPVTDMIDLDLWQAQATITGSDQDQ